MSAPATPTMQAVYKSRPLDEEEILPLVAYLADKAVAPPESGQAATLIFMLLGLAGTAAVLVLFDVVWKKRFRAVRRPLVHGTPAEGKGLIAMGKQPLDQGYRRPRISRVGRVLPQPLAARPDRCAAPTASTAPAAVLGMVYVKDGIITWEMQATRLPRDLEAEASRPTNRGAASAASHISWYIYSPHPGQIPLPARRTLMDLWREAKSPAPRPGGRLDLHRGTIQASRRQLWQRARGKGWLSARELGRGAGDHRRFDYIIHDEKTWSRTASSVSPPSRPCLCSATLAGTRFLQLLGGDGSLSASTIGTVTCRPHRRKIWGEQTDVAESRPTGTTAKIHRGDGLQPEHDADAQTCHFVGRGATRRRQDWYVLLAGLSARSPSTLIGGFSNQRRAGRRVLDGGVDHVILKEFHARPLGAIFCRSFETLHRALLS